MEDRKCLPGGLLSPLPPESADEERRLAALYELAILDSNPDPSFDRLTQLASLIFDAPIALVTFVDRSRQWFKSKAGAIEATETPRAFAFCAYTILSNEVLVVPDASEDLRFSSNPFVCGTTGVQFYAGAPIRSRSGHNIGSLCIIDTKPREALTVGQEHVLASLAALASEACEAHKLNLELALDGAEARNRYSLVVRATLDGVWDWDIGASRVYYSPRWQALLGMDEQECHSDLAYWLDRIHPEDRDRVNEELQKHREGETPRFLSEHRVRHGDASWRWVIVRGLAQRSLTGIAVRMAGSLMDVTKDRTSDSLTGLPNRLSLMEHLARLIANARSSQVWNFAVLFVDVDHFRQINDRFGHLGGDAVLRAIAERLTACLSRTRASAQSFVARFSGDEFVLLVHGVENSSQAYGIAQRLHADVNQPVEYEGESLHVGISIGIAMAKSELTTPESFLHNSDLALKRAKTDGRATSVVFDPSMQEESSARIELEDGLRQVIDSEHLKLHFQPQIEFGTNMLVGCEALVRWQHPKLGLLAPGSFIEVAEEIGIISQLDLWVLKAACLQLSIWRHLPGGMKLRMSVNLSSHSLSQRSLTYAVKSLLVEYNLPADALCFELTESAFMRDVAGCIHMLQELRSIGVGLHMDDFGSGYSSFKYLSELPFDTLKIDRSFMEKFPGNQQAKGVVEGILALAHTLGLRVIAEGVESEEQADALNTMGCGIGQGYFFDQALTADSFLCRYLNSPTFSSVGPITSRTTSAN